MLVDMSFVVVKVYDQIVQIIPIMDCYSEANVFFNRNLLKSDSDFYLLKNSMPIWSSFDSTPIIGMQAEASCLTGNYANILDIKIVNKSLDIDFN